MQEETSYRILISSSMNSLDYEKENIQTFEKGTVDGVILCLTHETTTYEHLEELTSTQLPLVMFDNYNGRLKNAGHIKIDDHKAAYEAVNYFIKKEHRNIGFIGGSTKKSIFNLRYEGYIKAHNDFSYFL